MDDTVAVFPLIAFIFVMGLLTFAALLAGKIFFSGISVVIDTIKKH